MANIVAVTGHRGAGKDTAIQPLLDNGYVVVKFAGALKAMMRAVLEYQGVDDETIERMTEGDLKEVDSEFLGGRSPRYFMIKLGTEFGRDIINENFWVDIWKRRCELFDNVVTTDLRFENEEKAANELGATIIRIEREQDADTDWGNHPSEAYIDKMQVHVSIMNDGTIKELQDYLSSFVLSEEAI